MKHLLIGILLLIASSVQAQSYDCGYYLKQSATYEYAALGCALTSAFCFGQAQWKPAKKRTFNTAGAIFAIAAVSTKFISISYKSRAGKELTVGAGYIAYNF